MPYAGPSRPAPRFEKGEGGPPKGFAGPLRHCPDKAEEGKARCQTCRERINAKNRRHKQCTL